MKQRKKLPCANCITLSICKASLQGYDQMESHSQVAVLAKLLIKCPPLKEYYKYHCEHPNEPQELDQILTNPILNI